MNGESSLLLCEHKVDMIMSVSDRVTVMQNGSVLASGAPEEIKGNDPAVIDAYLGTPNEPVLGTREASVS